MHSEGEDTSQTTSEGLYLFI